MAIGRRGFLKLTAGVGALAVARPGGLVAPEGKKLYVPAGTEISVPGSDVEIVEEPAAGARVLEFTGILREMRHNISAPPTYHMGVDARGLRTYGRTGLPGREVIELEIEVLPEVRPVFYGGMPGRTLKVTVEVLG